MNVADGPLRPDWELLASWVAVMEAGSVSGAARALRISQAAVSQRVKQLEAVFCTALLDRTTRPARPTPAGRRLFEGATDLLTRADQMIESVRNVSRAKRAVVRIGCVDAFAATIGPLLIQALSGSSHQIRLWSGHEPMLDELLESRQLDLAVTTGTQAPPGTCRSHLFSERFLVVLPATFEPGQLNTLRDLGRQLQFLRYSSRSPIGQQVDEYLLRNGDALERTCEFDTTDPLLSLVASGMGFALSTPLCLWQSRQFIPGIRVMELSAFSWQGRAYPAMSRDFHLSSRQGELGSLPLEVRDMIRVAVRTQLAGRIVQALGLERDAMWTPSETDRVALASA